MEEVSRVAFLMAIAATGVASLCFWAHLLGVRLVMRRLSTETGEGPVVATLERNGGASRFPASLSLYARFAVWTALGAFVVSLIARWLAVHHAPWSNMYEFTIAFTAGITVFYAGFERFYQDDDHAQSARVLGALTLPVVFTMLVLTAAFFPSEVRPLVPALQNADLLAVHVAAMILAYSALSVSFAAAVLYLAQGKGNRFARLPDGQTLDDIAYRSVMLGFPLLAIGIALGAYWANSAWGRYWGWDPKETSALVTWLIYGIYLHMRGLRNSSGTRSAVVLIAGFGAVMFTYFAVNLWVSGLHSYAGV
ncbi:MAG: c-type cytochrome biogenesis protein CcsB [Chloroflexi bacterium]|nr:MAG: c-type cytochrome biogenesis protein CcsB [Chloroflexota bacterium]